MPACRLTYMAYRDIIANTSIAPDAFRYETRDFPLETSAFRWRHGSPVKRRSRAAGARKNKTRSSRRGSLTGNKR